MLFQVVFGFGYSLQSFFLHQQPADLNKGKIKFLFYKKYFISLFMQYNQHKIIQLSRNKLAKDYMETGKTLPLDIASAQIGISKPTLSRFLRGKNIDLETFTLICTWLNTPASEFIY